MMMMIMNIQCNPKNQLGTLEVLNVFNNTNEIIASKRPRTASH